MWSARLPSTVVRQTIAPVFSRIATTSAKLGRDTYRKRPSSDVNASSTSWSWPSPTSWRMARK